MNDLIICDVCLDRVDRDDATWYPYAERWECRSCEEEDVGDDSAPFDPSPVDDHEGDYR